MQSKNRCLRVSDEVWARWQEQAKEWGMPLVQALQTAMAAAKHEARPAQLSYIPEPLPVKLKPAKLKKATVKHIEARIQELPSNACDDFQDIAPTKTAPGRSKQVAIAAQISTMGCDHAGTEIGKLSGVGACPKCGKMVTK